MGIIVILYAKTSGARYNTSPPPMISDPLYSKGNAPVPITQRGGVLYEGVAYYSRRWRIIAGAGGLAYNSSNPYNRYNASNP